ncbi:MAG: RNA polymerase sigma factor [Polyangiaceae bacterium]|nr:RNA polymerase sigma factor [Polyangiaceae bacterium]
MSRVPEHAAPEAHPASPAQRELSDRELIGLVVAGSPEGASVLYRRLLPVIERTTVRVLGRREQDHDDLLQLSFEQIIRTLMNGRFAQRCSLTTWACTIAARVGLAELRRRYRRRRLFVQTAGEEAEHSHELARSWERHVAALDELDLVRRALGPLNPDRAWVLYLHDVEGHRLADIAVMVGASVASVQSRLVRGRREFMQQYAELRRPEDLDCGPARRGAP